MFRKRFAVLFAAVSLVICFSFSAVNAEELDFYADVRGRDLSGLDLRKQLDVLLTLTFDTYTTWPAADKLPEGFDPAALLELGKDPGLGIRELQSLGFNGAGVVVAYVDQGLLLEHTAYDNVRLHYEEVVPSKPSMHGPSVLSLLAGKDLGLIPEAEVYFFAHPAMDEANKYEALAFERILELNETLPEHKKIRVVGMSHTAEPKKNEEYARRLLEVQQKARESGIIVVDSGCGMATAGVKGYQDRDDYRNYEPTSWQIGGPAFFQDRLIVPADNRTTAVGSHRDPYYYVYWNEGGFSWGVPYITGLIAMALQIDPNLTEEEAFSYLHASAYSYQGGSFVNPKGFLEMVAEAANQPLLPRTDMRNYRYFLYNSREVTGEDLAAIQDYITKLSDTENILVDVSKFDDALEVYAALKADAAKRRGYVKGIQILGSSEIVPAFYVEEKIQMQNGVDQGGYFYSDFFYSNFDNDPEQLEGFSLYRNFADGLGVSFAVDWPVARLPLRKGEFAPYFARVEEYAFLIGTKPFGDFVNFSNPIFASSLHKDDFNFFFRERLDKEFRILSSDDYRLYANQAGYYPVQTPVLGDFSRENIAAENRAGIREFVINSHGQRDNIDQCIFTDASSASEQRISFLNMDNINDVLSANYYELTIWACKNGYRLRSNTLIHEAMANGLCISAFAGSSILSNSGVDNKAYLKEMKQNNHFYFHLNYFLQRAQGQKRSESFALAKRAYVDAVLQNTHLVDSSNYQYNLHNVLSYHFFGLLEYWDYQPKENFLPDLRPKGEPKLQTYVESSASATRVFDGNIVYNVRYNNDSFKVLGFTAVKSGSRVEFTLEYESSKRYDFSFFNPPNGDVIMKQWSKGIKKGTGSVSWKLSKKEMEKLLTVPEIAMIFGFDDQAGVLFFDPRQLEGLLQ